MKKTIQIIFVVLAFISFTAKAQSQDGYVPKQNYSNSIGLRLGSENGISFKHFYKPDWAFEASITTGYRAIVLTGLFEKHFPLSDVQGLNLFCGGGVHAGAWGRVIYYRHKYTDGEIYYYRDSQTIPSIGIDGIVGLEYQIPKAPFTIGMDLKPYFDFFYLGESWVEGALSFRYVFQ
jgi:hypothetical protein